MIKKLFITVAVILFLLISFEAQAKIAMIGPFSSLIGGGFGALDAVECEDILRDDTNRAIATGDIALVIDSSNLFYVYKYNADGEASESSPAIIVPDDRADCSNKGQWDLMNIYGLVADTDFYAKATADTTFEVQLNNKAGLLAVLSDVSSLVQNNEKFTGQVTLQEFTEDDPTPDVSNAALGVNNFYYTNAANPTTITDFDDGTTDCSGDTTPNHSCFADGDWFILKVGVNSTIDFSENANIEGNSGVDFTGTDEQSVYLLFIYESARWNCVNFTSGFSSPTVFAPSAINMNNGLISQECCESFTILEPDTAQAASDDIKLKKFCAEAYPYGVTVTAIHINTDGTDISDTFLFEQWDDADGTNQVTLESIALSATDTGEDDGDMSSTDIPADHYFNVNLDDTSDDYKHVIITICYTIDPS